MVLIPEAGRRGREHTSYVTDHNDAADDDNAHYCTSQERSAQMAQILGSKEAWKEAYSPYVTDHNDAADDEDAHLGDCEASAIRVYPQERGLSRRPRNAPLSPTHPLRQPPLQGRWRQSRRRGLRIACGGKAKWYYLQ